MSKMMEDFFFWMVEHHSSIVAEYSKVMKPLVEEDE